MFYLFGFLILTGLILCNLNICRCFHQKLQELRFDDRQLKNFDVASITSGISPAFLLLPFLFWLNENFFILSTLELVIFICIMSFYNNQIHTKDKDYSLWWQKFSRFDKLLLILMVIMAMYLCYRNTSLGNMILLINFNVFFVYVFFFKQMKKQYKFSSLFSNKYINFIGSIFSNLFYCFSWLVVEIYIVSMSINMFSEYFDPYDTDGCMDTGICKEGYTFNDCGNGAPCTITKESCIENNNVWLENIRSCDTRRSPESTF